MMLSRLLSVEGRNEDQRTVAAVQPELGLQNTILSKAGQKFLKQGSFSMSHSSI